MLKMFLLMLIGLVTICQCDAATPSKRIRFGTSGLLRAQVNAMLPAVKYTAGTTKSGDWTWTTTVTTNSNNKIDIVSSGTNAKTKVNKTVWLVWQSCEVPVRFRESFAGLSDEEKADSLSNMSTPWTEIPSQATILPKKLGEEKNGDDVITVEIREIEVREEL